MKEEERAKKKADRINTGKLVFVDAVGTARGSR